MSDTPERAKKPRIKLISDERIVAALYAAGGHVEHAAKLCRCSDQTIYNRVSESETVKAALEDARNEMDRAADITLLDALHGKGDFKKDTATRVRAAMFVKNNSPTSKAKGWGTRTEITGVNGGPVTIDDWRADSERRRLEAAATTALFGDSEPG